MKTIVFFLTYIYSKKLKFESDKKPNIVLIVADDYGYNDIGYHGSEIKTPNLDKISANGVRLENYYVQPICTPSRSQLMTGRYQIHTGLQHSLIWRGMPSGIPPDSEMLPETLKRCGYQNYAAGKWHLGYAKSSQTPWGRGFDKFTGYLGGSEDYYKKSTCQVIEGDKDCGIDYTTEDKKGKRIYTNATSGSYSTFDYVQKAEEYISSRDDKDPFFLYLPFQSVHMPLQAPEEYITPYRQDAASKQRAIYSGMVAVLDEAVGNITNYLKENNLWSNTILIFTTDNGGQAYAGGSNLPYRGNKGTYWEGGVRGIGFVAGGKIQRSVGYYTNLMHISDWYPTMMSLTGCEQMPDSPQLDGHSHWPNLLAPNKDLYVPRQSILHNIDPLSDTDGTDDRGYVSDFNIKKQAALRWRNYKILTGDPGYPDYPIPIPPNETTAINIDADINMQGAYTLIPVRPTELTRLVLLYDIEADPFEKRDISDANLEIVVFLLAQLSDYNSTQVPVNFPPADPLSFAKFQGGFYKPWLG